MTYLGSLFQINCGRGGFSFKHNEDEMIPEMMLNGSKNLNLVSGREPRGGTSHVNGNVISGSPEIMGLYDFAMKNGTQFLMWSSDDGKVYKDFVNTILTGAVLNRFFDWEIMNDVLYFCNGKDSPQTWDGSASSSSDFTNEHEDWTGTNKPFQLIKHGRGLSERMWGILKDAVYASKLDVGNEFVSEDQKIPITLEGGIVGAIEFGDRLIVFGKTKAVVIDDSSTTASNWGYNEAQWEGGAGGFRLLMKYPNDLISFTEDGDIYSVLAAQEYGDYKVASLSKPQHINHFLQDELDLSRIEQFHTRYDPVLRAGLFFVIRSGQTKVDTCLVHFLDRGKDEGWIIKDNLDYVSGYSASSSALVRQSQGDYKVYTGGYVGTIWQLEDSTINDNSNPYFKGFITPHTDCGQPEILKQFDFIRISLIARTDVTIKVKAWIDGVPVSEAVYLGTEIGSHYLATDKGEKLVGESALQWELTSTASTKSVDLEQDIGVNGEKIKLEIWSDDVNQNYLISKVVIGFKAISIPKDL